MEGHKYKNKRENGIIIGLKLLFVAILLFGGVAVSGLIVWLNGRSFGFYIWPLAVCLDLFICSTVGFFATGGRLEILYGICSMIGAACSIVQLALLF